MLGVANNRNSEYFALLFLWISNLFLALTLLSCSGNEADPRVDLSRVSSQICQNSMGTEGLYWDILNGVPRGDIPGGLPTVANIGGNYIHSGYPPLGFIYPSGYRPVELRQEFPQLVGVNMLRNDDQSLWRYVNQTFLGPADASQVVEFELNEFLQFVGGNQQQMQVICTNAGTQQPIPTIVATNQSLLVRVQGFTALFVVGVNFATDLGVSFISTQVSFAPTEQFDQEVLGAFLPIHWQLLVRERGEWSDRDGDGVPDHLDRFPDDPTRW
ncbi:hypothetical protein [Pleomorphovibrio marinus]|uniref:hypothetical protein n=1 Tax=Pleomorphovibrio marinus TaxID=2164132 RepID=UPI000E0A4667|nr:hypothetical protein [Pleomorphovibrio marinus]